MSYMTSLTTRVPGYDPTLKLTVSTSLQAYLQPYKRRDLSSAKQHGRSLMAIILGPLERVQSLRLAELLTD